MKLGCTLLDDAKSIIRVMLDAGLPEPSIFGHRKGGVSLQWDGAVVDVLDTKVKCWCDAPERKANFQFPEGIQDIKAFVLARSEEPQVR